MTLREALDGSVAAHEANSLISANEAMFARNTAYSVFARSDGYHLTWPEHPFWGNHEVLPTIEAVELVLLFEHSIRCDEGWIFAQDFPF